MYRHILYEIIFGALVSQNGPWQRDLFSQRNALYKAICVVCNKDENKADGKETVSKSQIVRLFKRVEQFVYVEHRPYSAAIDKFCSAVMVKIPSQF